MGLAERGARIVHVGGPGYRRRLHGQRLNQRARSRHAERYQSMRLAHPELFAELPEHRRASDLSALRRMLYPLLYGSRGEIPLERMLKPVFDRLGIWTGVQRCGALSPASSRSRIASNSAPACLVVVVAAEIQPVGVRPVRVHVLDAAISRRIRSGKSSRTLGSIWASTRGSNAYTPIDAS